MLALPVREGRKAADFVPRGLDFGVVLNSAGRNTLRFIPPLIISPEEVHDGMERLRATIAATLAG
jgi:acetylornithine/succinyldiaminopimelate/putrescine aminotransferase